MMAFQTVRLKGLSWMKLRASADLIDADVVSAPDSTANVAVPAKSANRIGRVTVHWHFRHKRAKPTSTAQSYLTTAPGTRWSAARYHSFMVFNSVRLGAVLHSLPMVGRASDFGRCPALVARKLTSNHNEPP